MAGRVDDMLLLGVKNYKIITTLKKEFPKDLKFIPSNSQLSTRRHYLKTIVLKELSSKGEFATWAKKFSYNSKNKDHDLIVINWELSEEDFRLIYSTRGMLRNAVNQARTGKSFLALDSTHKIISCGFKLTILATTTANHEPAEIAFMVHRYEDSESYEFAFNEVKKVLKEIFKFNWQPKVSFRNYCLNNSILCQTSLWV
jgi:hypothetical protein